MANIDVFICDSENEDDYPDSVREVFQKVNTVIARIASRAESKAQASIGPSSLRSGARGRGKGRGVKVKI